MRSPDIAMFRACKLVGKGNDARLDRGQQQVVFQRIEQLGRCRCVQDLLARSAGDWKGAPDPSPGRG
jgi:hypothetical protein